MCLGIAYRMYSLSYGRGVKKKEYNNLEIPFFPKQKSYKKSLTRTGIGMNDYFTSKK